MRIVITESQYSKLINEEAEGIDSFVDEIIFHHPQVEQYKDFLKDSIEKSGCNRIFFDNIRSLGLSLHDKVVMSRKLLESLPELIFGIFHEIAHQYQYKKYGKELIYDMYIGELEMEGAIKFMKYLENTADQFGMRKAREFAKMGLDYGDEPIRTKGGYDHYTDKMFESYINMLTTTIKKSGTTDPDKISEYIYNMIKVKL